MEASRCANIVLGVVVDIVKERVGWLAGIVRANYARAHSVGGCAGTW